MFGGKSEVYLAWALGTDLYTDPVQDRKRTLSPTARADTGSHTLPQATSARAQLTAALCISPRELGEHDFIWGRQGRHRRIYVYNYCLRCHFKPRGDRMSPPLTGVPLCDDVV